ncbi:MAG TPA: NAD-dependent epimerase/dehydratase family protein [Acidobacteriaceae bacterium]|nr:NAD-dependent epimerase/dehydratase family protein [Acidobacteriaceae bacterium]
MTAKPLPPHDLDDIFAHTRDAFASLSGGRIFITGGTGLFGHWLLESLLHANAHRALNISATVLTRNAAAFREKSPHIAGDRAITLLEGDIESFAFPAEPHTHIIHAATDTVAPNAPALAASIIDGTRRVLEFARVTGARRLVYTSSGAVYGRGITDVARIAETHPCAPAAADSYDHAKRAAEQLCIDAPVATVIARCFAFVGPHLPLDRHFAIGNFICDALAGQPIHIKGDGTPLRSFLYMSDLAIWLWTMLATAPADRAYNVGSDESVSIAELAHLVRKNVLLTLSSPKGKDLLLADAIQIDGTPTPGAPPATYVPDITRAETELGLRVTVPLAEAIRRTAVWHMLPAK